MKGVSATGKELSITDEPVLYSASGTNFMPMEQIIQGISQRNEVMINCILEFYDTQKEKKGSNIWYVAKIKESFTKPPANFVFVASPLSTCDTRFSELSLRYMIDSHIEVTPNVSE